ncbi:MAG TPA: DUF899 family protein [Pseudonocardiaceae bacterium]|nr:DUF899 family protein [Pseudonocardiaceae bacterium]
MAQPEIVTREQWQQARDELLAAEKAATRTLDALAARRRRLPMVPFDGEYTFDTPDGRRSLLDLFAGRAQLVVYQFTDNGPDHYCPGCGWYTENVPAPAPGLLAESGVAYVQVSDLPLAQIGTFTARMGWTLPFVSSCGTTFSRDTGAGRGFSLTVFLRNGDHIYLTYTTTSRGVDHLAFVNSILDLTPFGRQEEWEDSPPGRPQRPTAIFPNTMESGMRPVGFGRFTRD